MEEPATPARRTVAARGATAPAKQMEDISLTFSTLVDDATSNGELVVATVTFGFPNQLRMTFYGAS